MQHQPIPAQVRSKLQDAITLRSTGVCQPQEVGVRTSQSLYGLM